MASVFKRVVAANVGTAPVTLLTVGALKTVTLIDVSCANVEPSDAAVTATVKQVTSGGTANLIRKGPVPAGGAMVVVGGPRRVVLATTDQLTAECSVATGIDVAVSYLEQDV